MNNLKQRGFTLIEFLIVTVLVAVIVVAVNQFYSRLLASMLNEQDITDAMWQGRLAIERMVKEIRATRSAADISIANSGEYSFTDVSGNTIDYTLSGNQLMRNSVVLADGINSLSFGYYDKNANVTSTPSSMSYVSIIINVTQKSSNYTLTAGLYLRDLSS